MRTALRTFVVTAAITLPLCAAEPERGVDQIVRSSASPAIAIRVDPSLPFLGHIEGAAMGGRARYEQFLFAESSGGVISRMFIVHFEHALEGADLRYRYPRLDMVAIGGEEYLRQTFPAMQWDLFTSPEMMALLRSRNVTAPKDWIVARWVRAADASLHSEIILFYIEPAPPLPAPAEDLGLAGKSRALWEPIGERLSTSGRRVFEVIGRQ